MLDGIIKTLHRVRHALILKRNPISLGMLNSSGYLFKSGSGGIRVTKGVMLREKVKRRMSYMC